MVTFKSMLGYNLVTPLSINLVQTKVLRIDALLEGMRVVISNCKKKIEGGPR